MSILGSLNNELLHVMKPQHFTMEDGQTEIRAWLSSVIL